MSYQDRYKGRKIKDPPSYLGRFGLFILVGAAFAAFVGCLRGLDSTLCALATLCVVACKLTVELIVSKAKFQLPEKFERFAQLPLAIWLLFWLLPIPPLWFVLRTIWPKNLDPNNALGTLTLICLGLYVPTILAIFKPIEKNKGDKTDNAKEQDQQADKINFDVDFNLDPDDKLSDSKESSASDRSKSQARQENSGKTTSKAKKKGKK